MADEVKLAFGLDGAPDANRAAWKSRPPSFLGDYHLADESYDTLVFEAQVMGVGMRILMFGMAKTLYRLSATFSDDPVGTRVTLAGQAKEDVRDEIGAYLREHTRQL
ncbi:MAG TPA: hypothetical protein VFZ17_02630 [Acidimicrobiia bacterium]|nr:hypothetical protein [Acidimicrobiia bacterium]